MNFDRLRASVVSELREEFKTLRGTVRDCPFHVHVSMRRGDRGSHCFSVCFSMSKHSPYDAVHDTNVVASLYGEVLDELFCGRIMAAVSVRPSKKELGRAEPKWDEHDWTRQDWRYEKFVVECSAAPLWNLLERSVDFEKLAGRVAAEVMEEG